MPVYGSFKYAEGKYGGGWQLLYGATVGSYRGHKFTLIVNADGQTQVHNKAIDSDTTVYLRYLERGAVIRFDTAVDHLIVFSPLIDDLQAADESNMFMANVDSSADFLQLRGADFYDGKKIKWHMGMVPFDTSLLNSTGWDDDTLTGADAGYITISSYVAGGYRAYVYLSGQSGDEDATFIITGALGTSGTTIITNISSSRQYEYVDFIAVANDSITFTVTRTGGSGAIDLGDLIVFPMRNSKNFPLDVRDHSLRLVDVQRMVE